MKILHIANISNRMHSGINNIVPQMVSTMAKSTSFENDNVELLLIRESEDLSKKINVPIHVYNSCETDFIYKYDLFIFHDTYIYEYTKLSKLMRDADKKYIIVPHGGFSAYAQRKKIIKKYLANVTLFRDHFNKASAIHFLSNEEKHKSKFNSENDFISPISLINKKDDDFKLSDKSNKFDGNIEIIYIGRLDFFIKGIDRIIIYAIKHRKLLRSKGINISLYGPKVGTSSIFLKLIKLAKIQDIIQVKSPVYGEEKHYVLSKAHYFLQTSRSEGLPLGILEALKYGIPCIVTKGTNFSNDIEEFDSGYVVNSMRDDLIYKILEDISNIKKYSYKCNNAVQNFNKYSWELINNHIHKIFTKLVKE